MDKYYYNEDGTIAFIIFK